jgi:hypothetical protein
MLNVRLVNEAIVVEEDKVAVDDVPLINVVSRL